MLVWKLTNEVNKSKYNKIEWIDYNYRLIEIVSKLKFLKHYKEYEVIPVHLNHMFRNSLVLHHHRILNKKDHFSFKKKIT